MIPLDPRIPPATSPNFLVRLYDLFKELIKEINLSVKTNADTTISGVLTVDGIKPSATSDTLSTYDENTWTPTVSGITFGGTPTTSYQYTQIGRMVFVNIMLTDTTSITVTAGATITPPVAVPTACGVSGVILNASNVAQRSDVVVAGGNFTILSAVSTTSGQRLKLSIFYYG